MSLFSSIQLAKNSLLISQLGIQVAGNNIANAGTPGYIRQEINLVPAPSQEYGDLLVGLGVRAEGISQKVDKFLEERLRNASSDLAKGETEEGVYLNLEALIGELGDSDLSTSLTNFFGAIHEVLNQPESQSVRNLAVLEGQTLAGDIQRLDSQVRRLRSDLNERVEAAAVEINTLTEEIAKLNVQIVAQEGGGNRNSDAVGLRDARQQALGRLSEIMDIRSVEQPTGSVTVFVSGTFIVFDGNNREVTTTLSTDRSLLVSDIRLAETDAPLESSSGEVAGLINARDNVLGGFLDELNGFTETLAFEFNKIYSGGQGLIGFDSLTSEEAVDDVNEALDQAGLDHTPVNGSLQIQVYNKQTGLFETTDLFIDLDGLDEDTTLSDFATMLDDIEGISASLTASRRLQIDTDSENVEFAFANDTSGVLAALGLNTFFTGSDAVSIGVSDVVRADPSFFAGSRGGIGADVENLTTLAAFFDQPLESQGDASLAEVYDRFIGETIQAAATTRSVAQGFRVFEQTLRGEQLSVSGVSIDEEAVRMLSFQRSFQASARYIQTVSDLLELLVNL